MSASSPQPPPGGGSSSSDESAGPLTVAPQVGCLYAPRHAGLAGRKAGPTVILEPPLGGGAGEPNERGRSP